MGVLQIILTAFIFLLLLVLLLYIWYSNRNNVAKKDDPQTNSQEAIITTLNDQFTQNRLMQQKLNDLLLEMKTTNQTTGSTVGTLTKDIQNLNTAQGFSKDKIDELLHKIHDLGAQSQQVQNTSGNLSQKIESLNNIFINNYQRGKLGETSLAFILESMLGNNADVVLKQHTLSNHNRVDVLLKGPGKNIPIDSKFPYDNFVKIFELKKDSAEYIETVKKLKTDIKNKLTDIAKKYISPSDNTFEAVMYIPSQTLFEFIYSEKDFKDITKLSADEKVWISGPNTLPILLNAVGTFVSDWKRSQNIIQILKSLEKFKTEFIRFDQRWNKLMKGIKTVVGEVNDVDITSKKITRQFEEITNPKLIESAKKEDAKDI